MPRDDFPSHIKHILAQRVNSFCSRCQASTSGPQTNPESSLNIGLAAHITSAAQGGPRYDPVLSHEARRSATNGIWLCQNCAKLVDNDPSRFPDKLLREWKARSEARVLDDIGRPKDVFVQVGVDYPRTRIFLLPATHRRNPFFLDSPVIK